mmetsp:Transcript_127971/g.358247  ORF Transcript_127971/g.358247 Transcript_127971/m.358247 type:complete len:207 (-) Transcript_127971:96-716(-)
MRSHRLVEDWNWNTTCTAAIPLSRRSNANFVGGKYGWCSRCLDRLPAPRWQPSCGTLKAVPSSVQISRSSKCESRLSNRSSKVHWWQTNRSPFRTCSGWYFGQTMCVAEVGSPKAMTTTRFGCTRDWAKTQWNGAMPSLWATSMMIVFRSFDPKLHGNAGSPCKNPRDIRRPSCAKNLMKVDAEPPDSGPNSGNQSASRNANQSVR